MRLRSLSIAAFVRRIRRLRSSSRSCRNWNSERIVWSATRAAVTSRTSSRVRGGSVGTAEVRDSRCSTCPSGREICDCPPVRMRTNASSAPTTTEAIAVHGWSSIDSRGSETIEANASFTRSTTPRSSSSTMPSSAVSNTRRRCSSDWRRVSFASRTRSSAWSVSSSARSRSSRASLVSRCAMRARRLVRQDARGDAEPEQQDDRRRLCARQPARVVEDRDRGERRAGRDHRHAREDRAGPAARRDDRVR